MRIAFVDLGLGLGGGQLQLATHCKLLQQVGVDPVAVVRASNEALARSLEGADVRWVSVAMPVKWPANRLVRGMIEAALVRRSLGSTLQAIKPEIIVAYTFQSALALCLTKVGRNIPFVHFAVGALYQSRHGFLDRFVLRRLDGLIANSEFTLASYRKHLPVTCPVEVVYSVVESPGVVERHVRVSNHGPIIGFLGRLHPRKRAEDLIEAAALLLTEFPELEVRFVGGTSSEFVTAYQHRLRALATKLLGDQAVFMGHADDVYPELAKWDCLVLPSLDEPFGRVYVEAAQIGVPFVGTAPGGPAEILTILGSEYGAVARAKDPTDLARAIRDVLRRDLMPAPLTTESQMPRPLQPSILIDRERRFYEGLLEDRRVGPTAGSH